MTSPAGAIDNYPMSEFLQRTKSKLSIFKELWDFLRVRKKWWLGPIFIVLILLSLLIVLTQGSAVAPFIYTVF